MKFFRIKPDKISRDHYEIQRTVEALKSGKIVIIPSDTVYGLVCDAFLPEAVERIYVTKQRRKSNPLPIFFYSRTHAAEWVKMTPRIKSFLNKVWPGKVTVILPLKNEALENEGLAKACTNLPYCGARVPDYKLIRILISELDCPLAESSANISGLAPSVKIEEVLAQFEKRAEQPDIILDAGVLPESEVSTVIGFDKGELKIVRKGAVSAEKLIKLYED